MKIKLVITVLIILCVGILIYVLNIDNLETQEEKNSQKETENIKQVVDTDDKQPDFKKEEESDIMVQDQTGVEKVDKIEEKGKVKGTITISPEIDDNQARELADQYAKELETKNEKDIVEVQVVREGKGVTTISYKKVKQDSSGGILPIATAKVINGLLVGTKEVYVTLDTEDDENYSVIVEDKELTYAPKKDQFIAVVKTTKSLEDLKLSVQKK